MRSQEWGRILAVMPVQQDMRRAALSQRLAKLKGLVLGLSASATIGVWWLVSSTVAATQASAATTTNTPSTTTTRPDRDDDSFFDGGQGTPSLGSGASGGFGSAPTLRSGGS